VRIARRRGALVGCSRHLEPRLSRAGRSRITSLPRRKHGDHFRSKLDSTTPMLLFASSCKLLWAGVGDDGFEHRCRRVPDSLRGNDDVGAEPVLNSASPSASVCQPIADRRREICEVCRCPLEKPCDPIGIEARVIVHEDDPRTSEPLQAIALCLNDHSALAQPCNDVLAVSGTCTEAALMRLPMSRVISRPAAAPARLPRSRESSSAARPDDRLKHPPRKRSPRRRSSSRGVCPPARCRSHRRWDAARSADR
jgi:hypothetical protein